MESNISNGYETGIIRCAFLAPGSWDPADYFIPGVCVERLGQLSNGG